MPIHTQRPTTCYAPDVLRRFLAEELDESEEERIGEHLGACTACQSALERASASAADIRRLREGLLAAPAPAGNTGGPARQIDELAEIAALCDPSDDPRTIGRIGGYGILGLIGRGTTGYVLKAIDPSLDRYVALKLLAPVYRSNVPARQRFEREGRAIAAVSHEHVVPVHSVDEHRGLPFIVMQYVPGKSLEERIRADGALDTFAVARVGLQVAKALAAAHAQGIVHRDVKPANVLLEGTVERALVTDFGLASVADEASLTLSGTISGTPHYMSPEQARGESAGPASDLFSLGSLLYAACTGRPPFRAENVFGVIQRVANVEPLALREVNPKIAPWLAAVVERLMAKRPEHRFASAREVASVLEAELAHAQNPLGIPAPAREWMPRTGEPARRRVAAGALAAMIAGLGALAFSAPALAEPPSGVAHASEEATDWLAELSPRARAKVTGPPRPGALATVRFTEPLGNVDGYTLYLPLSHAVHDATYPLVVYLQDAGAGVAHDTGLLRLLRDEDDLASERNRLLLDGCVVVAPHLGGGRYDDHPEAIAAVIDRVLARTKSDPERITLTGLGKGADELNGLAASLPDRFAALLPMEDGEWPTAKAYGEASFYRALFEERRSDRSRE